MKSLSKICDAADWFDAELHKVIVNELKEEPRFHRKQWEFAIIFLALKKLGFLNGNSTGLSLGGGNERVLYSIANHVKKLIVTDLYEEGTTWDCARTTDPDEFIKQSKPFDVDESRIQALRMDMRYLEFEDNTFDFCYSSCAIEHIGTFEDFVQHLNEVYRCLKEDGVYVFTTELQLGDVTVEDPNNHIFSPEYLKNIFSKVHLSAEFDVDADLTPHEINRPFPSNIKNLCFNKENGFADELMKNYQHIILLRGKYPFTSVQFIFRKKTNSSPNEIIKFNGLSETIKYVDQSVNDYKKKIEDSITSMAPFSSLPHGVSHFYLDHANFFLDKGTGNNDHTIFHTDYFWLGGTERVFKLKFNLGIQDFSTATTVQIRIHKYSTLKSGDVNCVFEKNYDLTVNTKFEEHIIVKPEEDYCYAILGKMISGNFKIKDITVESWTLDLQSVPDVKGSNVQPIVSVV